MKTRIRELRRSRELTLQEVADLVGTTPQTVQRLETANMTMSTDWLERFARAFGVHPSDLIEGAGRSIECLGELGPDAGLDPGMAAMPSPLALDLPTRDAVAVRVGQTVGPYPAGAILIGRKLRKEDTVNAHGADCIVCLDDGHVLLRRVITGRTGTVTLVPHEENRPVRYDERPRWIAPLFILIRHF